MTPSDRKGAVVILVYDGLLLLQLRDNKPNIKNPNKWALPGGGQKPREEFSVTISREICAELGIAPTFHFLEISPRGNGIFTARLTRQMLGSIRFGAEGQTYAFFAFDQLKRINLGGELYHYLVEKPQLIQDLLESG